MEFIENSTIPELAQKIDESIRIFVTVDYPTNDYHSVMIRFDSNTTLDTDLTSLWFEYCDYTAVRYLTEKHITKIDETMIYLMGGY